jgi:oxepin-CoA hydrolase/3-oxo-5,6-dehydrosuberyl-CoA semialdehyde dehydrogenase
MTHDAWCGHGVVTSDGDLPHTSLNSAGEQPRPRPAAAGSGLADGSGGVDIEGARSPDADGTFAREVALGAAPWHGRLLVLDRDNAGESTGHGSPLPHTNHGGPGRAGGGEELAGLRSVLHHMQRTAVQAHPDLLATLTEQTV